MKLHLEMKMRMILYNKYNMEPLLIENVLKEEWEEESEEYQELVRKYEGSIGYVREKKVEKEYDAELLKLAASEAKESMLASVMKVASVIRESFLYNRCAYVEYMGYIINPKDFCAVRVCEPIIKMCKE